ncbi:MAG: hypothetical protein MJZ69_06110 [Bacteroidaceae bacterium]|nr:hypothetical protein [Bacteroidaceae bacterium]
MKTLLKGITFAALSAFALASCTADKNFYDPEEAQKIAQAEAEAKFQAMKLPCVNAELAQSTNWYGMGLQPVTRSTDAGQAPQAIIDAALESYTKNPPTQVITPTGKKFVTTIRLADNTQNFYLNTLGTSNVGRQVYLDPREYTDMIKTNTSDHKDATFVSNGEFDFIIDGDNPEGFVYIMSDYRLDGYLLCVEDLGGSSLDYNDIVIYGAQNTKPRIIWRGGNLKLKITADNQTFTTGTNEYGAKDIELPFNNMNSPSSWNNAKFVVVKEDGLEIEIKTKMTTASDQPAVIATYIFYKFHKDENSMSSAEFASIPYYGM